MSDETREDHLYAGIPGSGTPMRRGWSDEITGLGIGVHLDYEAAEQLYRFFDLAARICELPVAEALAEPWEYRLDDAELRDQLAERLQELDAVQAIADAQVFARVHGDCFLYLAVEDGLTDLVELNPARVRQLRYLRKIERRLLAPKEWYTDIRDPRYGEPMTYTVAGVRGAAQVEVHESRFLKFYGARTSDASREEQSGWHDSVLQRVSAVLRDFDCSWAAATKLLSNSIQGVYKIKGLTHGMAAPGGLQSIERRFGLIDQYRSVFKAILVDADKEEFSFEVAPLASLPELLDRFASRLAAAADGIPVTKLFGISPAGMNATGESDAKNWYRILGAFRRDRLQPAIETLTEILLAEANRSDEEFAIVWPDIDQPTEKETAEVRLLTAQADQIYLVNSVVEPEEIAASRFGGPDGWSSETTLLEVDPEKRKAAADEAAAEEAATAHEQAVALKTAAADS